MVCETRMVNMHNMVLEAKEGLPKYASITTHNIEIRNAILTLCLHLM